MLPGRLDCLSFDPGPIMAAGDPDANPQPDIKVDDEAAQPFTFAFHMLSVCAGGGHVKRRHVVKLLEMSSGGGGGKTEQQTHNIGTE